MYPACGWELLAAIDVRDNRISVGLMKAVEPLPKHSTDPFALADPRNAGYPFIASEMNYTASTMRDETPAWAVAQGMVYSALPIYVDMPLKKVVQEVSHPDMRLQLESAMVILASSLNTR